MWYTIIGHPGRRRCQADVKLDNLSDPRDRRTGGGMTTWVTVEVPLGLRLNKVEAKGSTDALLGFR